MNIYGYPFAWIYVLHHFEQLGLVTRAFNTSVWEAEAEESWNGDYYWLHRDFQSTMGYTGRPCLKQNKENKNKTFQGIHLGVELWEQWASPYLTFWGTATLVFIVAMESPLHPTFLPTMHNILATLITFGVLRFFIIIFLVGVKWYLTVVLICIPQMTNDTEHLPIWILAVFILSL